MKQLLFLILLASAPLLSWSQQAKIKGQLKDKDSLQFLKHATALLFMVKDSTLKASVFTDKNGTFELSGLSAGNYVLHISYMGYQPVAHAITIKEKDTLIDLEIIRMRKNGLTLQEVEIIGKNIPVMVKKDTLEFGVVNVETRENAALEELLKKLPGLQIDRDGTIRVQGETVKKILIEGRQFFGDNPTAATRSLPAEMIDKVQLINRETDEARLSGVEDDKREKAINITLKKKWKQEIFGKLTGGYGTEERFAVNGNLNRISDKQQLILLMNGNNTNSYQDGRLPINMQGITRDWKTSINYNEFIGKKLKLAGNYIFNDTYTVNQRASNRQNFVQESTFYYNEQASSNDKTIWHSLGLEIEYTIDSLHTLNNRVSAGYNTTSTLQEIFYESLESSGQLLNKGSSFNTNKNNALNIYNSITFAKRFRKAGRSLSASFNFALNSGDQHGFLRSDNLFLQPPGAMDTLYIDQHNKLRNSGYMLQGGFNYTEQLLKDHSLRFAYVYTYSYAASDKFTYDYNSIKKIYDRLNDSLTNSFSSVLSFQYASLSLRTQKEKYNYTIGINALLGNMNNKNIYLQRNLQVHNAILYPTAFFNYTFTNSKRLFFGYTTDIQQPSVADLQPVPDNSNPLYIRKGNPDLKIGRTDNFNLSYSAFNARTLYSLSARINAGITSNKIVQATWFDTAGRQVSQPLNMHGAYTIGASVEQSIPVKQPLSSIKTNTVLGFNRDINYINGIRGNVNNYNIAQTISINYTHQQLLDMMATAQVNYNQVQYSTQRESNTKYFNYTFSLNGNINLPLGLIINCNVDYMLNTGRAAGYNLDFTMLNAFISKSIFKHKQGVIKLQGFDLLRQNVTIVRTVGQSYIEDVQTKALQRFFMLSFSYHLKPKP